MNEQPAINQCRIKEKKTLSLPLVSLFSGAGGLDLGFIEAGFNPVIGVDHDTAACKTYIHNNPGVRILKRDLSTVPEGYILDRIAELPDVVKPVGVIGGPPCQAFSMGNRNGRKNDARAKLPNNYARVLHELASFYEIDFFLFENVIGLKHKEHSESFLLFKTLFASAGFLVFEKELDAQNFGVAQVRNRIFVVGFNKRKYEGLVFEFPKGTTKDRRTVRDMIGGLPQPLFFDRGLTASKIPFHPNHWCMRPRSEKFFNGYLREGDVKGRPFRVLSWDKPSWTVAYGNREVHIHPNGERRLSVYEAMLLQGFPPKYELRGTLSDQIRLISDAVPPPMAKSLAESIISFLQNGAQTPSRK